MLWILVTGGLAAAMLMLGLRCCSTAVCRKTTATRKETSTEREMQTEVEVHIQYGLWTVDELKVECAARGVSLGRGRVTKASMLHQLATLDEITLLRPPEWAMILRRRR